MELHFGGLFKMKKKNQIFEQVWTLKSDSVSNQAVFSLLDHSIHSFLGSSSEFLVGLLVGLVTVDLYYVLRKEEKQDCPSSRGRRFSGSGP